MSAAHGRLVLIVGLLFGYLLYSSFSTALVSQLAIGHYSATPSLSKIFKSYRIFVLDADVLATVQAAKGPWATARIADDVGLVCQDGVALLVEEKVKKLAPCEVALLPEKYFKSHWGFVMRKGAITSKIRKMYGINIFY